MGSIVCLSRTYRLKVLRRNAAPNLVGRYFCVLQYQCTGSHNGALTYLTTIEQSASHADERSIMNGHPARYYGRQW